MSKYSYTSCVCSECTYINLSDRNRFDSEQAYCTKRREYVDKNSRACSRYFDYDETRGNVNGTCYLTTIISEVLGYRDDCNYLEILRTFRDEYMLENINMQSILYEYDTIGPILANAIRTDDRKEEICTKLFQNYIDEIIRMIQRGEYLSAIMKYIQMVNQLKEFYKGYIEGIELGEKENSTVTGKGYLKRNS